LQWLDTLFLFFLMIAIRSSYKEIAGPLNLSPATIRNRLAGIYGKLGIGDKTELTNLLQSAPPV